ncbi:MAG: glycosyltransferase [Candidatus Rokubacteria bacterium]|nr:glycosyltransferase [Candidatus Rokubacteria bacterium]
MVSVILPTYNERDGIAELVGEILAIARAAHLDVEVVVVDDDSPDGTAAHLEAVFRTEPAVRVRVRHGERGLATAVRRGLAEARGDLAVVMDSDGNHDPALLPLMARCAEEFDVVIGSRYVLGGGMLTSAFRYWASYAFNLLIRIVLGLRIHDNLSGYLAFRRSLLERLDPDRIFYGYGDYAIRLLHQVVRRGGRVLEIPTVYRFRKGGESKTRFLAYFWTYLGSVFRLRLLSR